MSFLRVLATLALAACGGKYPAKTPAKPDPAPVKGGIENAALPYQLLERGGHSIEEPKFWDRVAHARAVCVGEEHPNPHHHWVQLHVVRELAKRIGKDKLGVGLEMVQRPFQGPLDDYAQKKIDAATFQSRAGWAERWGYEWTFYQPTLDAATSAGGSLIALNAPKELVKKVVRQGLESLTDQEKRDVPELDLKDAAHRAWFDALMSDMGGAGVHSSKKDGDAPPNPHDNKTPVDGGDDKDKPANPHGSGAVEMPSAERIYTAQVLWDETMADGSVKWIKANPTGHLVILAGNGHCHDTAIVNRMKRRGVGDVVSIRVVIDDGESGGVADAIAKPINDYVVVLQMPKKPDAKTARR